MANFTVTLGIRDEDGAVSSVQLSLVAADMAAAIARAQAVMPLIDAVIMGRIDSCNVGQVLSTTSYTKAVPEAGSDVEVKGRFLFDSVGGYSTRISFPTFDKDAHTIPGGDIDVNDGADVEALVLELVTTGGWSDYRYADITGVKAAYEAFGR